MQKTSRCAELYVLPLQGLMCGLMYTQATMTETYLYMTPSEELPIRQTISITPAIAG